mmetsp:Transcript_9071/g.30137  ORF Transcript_9071/g.30137 Transcript_9071/m.30137 type:complete len:250 (+) Transcript_9071:44-793(+)
MTRTFGLLACGIASARALQSPMSGRWPQQRRSPGVDAVSSSQLSIDWTARELWALEDSVPQYTVAVGEGSGAQIILWRRMQLDVPELCGRSISELRGRWAAERGAAAAAVAAVDSPPCLERWERLPDGSYRGELTSVAGMRGGLVATVETDPDAAPASRAEAEGWCVRSRAGDLFELGAQRVKAEPAVAAADGAEQQLAPFSAALGAAPTPEAVAQLATPALALVALAAAVNVGMSAFGHHVDVSVFIV